MNTKINAILLSLALSGIFTQSAMAADATINITGNVVATPCNVDSGSKNVTVDLGDIQASALAAAGAATSWKLVTLTLSNCPTTTSQVIATFTGTADTANNANYYKNTGSGSTLASIQMDNEAASALLPPGSTITSSVSAGAATVKFNTRIVTVRGNVTPGIVSSALSVAFAYK